MRKDEEKRVPRSAEFELVVEGAAVGAEVRQRWRLDGGKVVMAVSDLRPAAYNCWSLSLAVDSPPAHKLDFHWLVALQINTTGPDGRTYALRQVNLPLEDGVAASIDFPPPKRFPADIRLSLDLRFVRKEQTELPVFAQRHPTDRLIQVHQRSFHVSPALLRLALLPTSPLLATLDAPGPLEWSLYFPSCEDFTEFLYHVYPTRRHVTHPTAVALGRLAVATHFPALQRKVCHFIRKAGGVPISWRLMVADSARLYHTIPIVLSRLSPLELMEVRKLVNAGIRHRFSFQGYSALLTVLAHPLQGDKLDRKRIPKSDFATPRPGDLCLRAPGAEFYVCRELLCELSPGSAGLLGSAPVVELGAEAGVVAAFLHLVYPERLLPREQELAGVLGLAAALGADCVRLELEERLRRKVGQGEGAVVAGLGLGRAWGLDWLLQRLVSGLRGRGVVERVRAVVGEDGWAGLGPELQERLWEAALGGQGLDLPDAVPNCFPQVRVSFTKGLHLPSSHTLFEIHNDVVFA